MNKLRKFPLVLMLVVALLASVYVSSGASAEKKYVLSYSPGTLFHQMVRDRIEVVYTRAGLDAEFVFLPHHRSLLSANEGLVDGDVGRVPFVEGKYPDLRRVNVKLMDLNGAAYTLRKDIESYDDELLKNYKVGYVLGVQWTTEKMKGLHATTAHDYPALFEMLLQGRIDIALATEASAVAAMRDLGERASSIRTIQPFVFVAPIYHYVHKRNQEIIPRLEQALTELTQEGYWNKPEEKKYIFYTGAQSPVREILEQRLQEAFRRSGKKCRVRSTGSAQRALMLANEDGDGDALRVPNIKELVPELTGNLVQIPEAIIDINFVVYTKDKHLPIEGWESLKGYRNGLRGGVKVLEENIPAQRTILPDSERLFQMLDRGRLDTVSEHAEIGDYIIKKLQISNVKKMWPPLISTSGFIFIHKKHQNLIPEITQILVAMKKDGSFEVIRDDVLTKMLAQ